MCSGAIVSSKSVLTTATCINNLQPEEVEVAVGSNKYYDAIYTYDVLTITKHPKFVSSTYNNDIAVLTLPQQITTYYNVAPIALATTLPSVNTVLIDSAFGAVDSYMTLPDTLQRTNLAAFPPNYCQTLKSTRLTDSNFCAGDLAGKKDMCPLDQGAPLVYQGKLYGIYSWGGNCGLAAPGPSSPVFT